MGFLKLFDDCNKNLIPLYILGSLLLDTYSVKMMDVFEPLSQLYYILLFLT
jgi:hypothetical protein